MASAEPAAAMRNLRPAVRPFGGGYVVTPPSAKRVTLTWVAPNRTAVRAWPISCVMIAASTPTLAMTPSTTSSVHVYAKYTMSKNEKWMPTGIRPRVKRSIAPRLQAACP